MSSMYRTSLIKKYKARLGVMERQNLLEELKWVHFDKLKFQKVDNVFNVRYNGFLWLCSVRCCV